MSPPGCQASGTANSLRRTGRTISGRRNRSRCSPARPSSWASCRPPDTCSPSRRARRRKGLDRALAQQGVAHRFVATRCADEGPPKPDPAMLLHLMERVGVGRRRDVDDRRHDARPRACATRRRELGGGCLWRARGGRACALCATCDRAFDGRARAGCAERECVSGVMAPWPDSHACPESSISQRSETNRGARLLRWPRGDCGPLVC